MWDGTRRRGNRFFSPVSRAGAKYVDDTLFHSPITEILRAGRGGADDTRYRHRVAQGDHKGDHENRDSHGAAVWSTNIRNARVTLVDRVPRRAGFVRSCESRSIERRRSRACDLRRLRKIGRVPAPGKYLERYNSSAFLLIGYICAACAHEFADNAPFGEGVWVTSPPVGWSLITRIARTMQISGRRARATGPLCRLSGGR